MSVTYENNGVMFIFLCHRSPSFRLRYRRSLELLYLKPVALWLAGILVSAKKCEKIKFIA